MDNIINIMDNKLKIINHLGKNSHKIVTMHELSVALSIPYATFHRTIMGMQELLIIQNVGKAKTIRLNTANDIVHAYLCIASEEEKKEYLQKQPTINLLAKDIRTNDVVLLFGSYAKKQERAGSDIDILVINKDGSESIAFSRQETILGIEINPMFFTEKEFKHMIADAEENVGKQALKHHIILNNQKRFWELVLDALRRRNL